MGWFLIVILFILAVGVLVIGGSIFVETHEKRRQPSEADWQKFRANNPQLYPSVHGVGREPVGIQQNEIRHISELLNAANQSVVQPLNTTPPAAPVSVTSENEIARPDQITPWEDNGWEVLISFGKSRSETFDQALYLARLAPQFAETEYNEKPLYQATYTAEPKQYLKFIKLYEIVKNWKSCNVFINGQLIDRKVVGQINYCYGDRCRSGNPSFCFGASSFTENPFGCHRVQISRQNHPWFSFCMNTSSGMKVNKPAMQERIDSYAQIYSLCPVFSYENILKRLHDLPDLLSIQEYQNLQWSTGLHIEIK